MNLGAEISWAASKIDTSKLSSREKEDAWCAAYKIYKGQCSLANASNRENCEWCASKANRFWPRYVGQYHYEPEWVILRGELAVYQHEKYGNWPHKRYFEEGEENNVVEFAKPTLIRSGLDGTPPTDNWLLSLPVGTIFTAKDKMDRTNFALTRFEVVRSEPKNVFLFAFSRDLMEQQPFGEVDPTRFINRFDLVERITEPTE